MGIIALRDQFRTQELKENNYSEVIGKTDSRKELNDVLMQNLSVSPSTPKQLAALTMAWVHGRSSIEVVMPQTNMLNVTGQFVQNAFYSAVCIALTNNHTYVSTLNSNGIEPLVNIGVALFTLFVSPITGIFGGRVIGAVRSSDDINMGDIQAVLNFGAVWYDGLIESLRIKDSVASYFHDFYQSIVSQIKANQSIRVDHYIHNLAQIISGILPTTVACHSDPQTLILKLRIANQEERYIASQNNINSGEIIALKAKPVLNTTFHNEVTNPVKMASYITAPQPAAAPVQYVQAAPQPAAPVQYVQAAPPTQQVVQTVPANNQIYGAPAAQTNVQVPATGQTVQYVQAPPANQQPVQYVQAAPTAQPAAPTVQYVQAAPQQPTAAPVQYVQAAPAPAQPQPVTYVQAAAPVPQVVQQPTAAPVQYVQAAPPTQPPVQYITAAPAPQQPQVKIVS